MAQRSGLKKLLKSVEFHTKNRLHASLAARAGRALARAAARLDGYEPAVALAREFSYYGVKIPPSQVQSEITGLLKLMASAPPRFLLELGTYKGGTFFLFTRVAAPDALLISLDLPLVHPGLGIPAWRDGLLRTFARDRQRIEIVRADCRLPSTFQQVQTLLAGRPLDFLLIDGEHSYEGVKRDYERYSPLVGPGGLIAFHDIAPCPPERNCGVPQFWQEIKPGREVIEFVEDWNQGGFGIGVVRVRA